MQKCFSRLLFLHMNNEQCKDHIKYGKGKAIKYFTSSLTNNQSKSIMSIWCAVRGQGSECRIWPRP